jgi:MarR family transcriptional regulator, organic hydroperoxide resistance regulator
MPTIAGQNPPAGKVSNSETDLDRMVWSLLYQLAMAERRNYAAACREFELTLPQSELLKLLGPGPMTMNGLATALECDASNITGIVDRLELRNLIQRNPDREDRRVKMIALTRSGRAFLRQLEERLSQPPASVSSLSTVDKNTLSRVFRQMIEAAQQQRVETPAG